MRYKGKKLTGANVDWIIFPRATGESVNFRLEAILDYSLFDKLTPAPFPPIRLKPGGVKVADVNDPIFKQSESQYSEMKFAWIVINTIKNTPGLEWETVDYGDPNTWRNYDKELRDSGFCFAEVQRLVNAVFEVNALNDAKMKEAKDFFLQTQDQEPTK